jgi:hypothetical protein
MQPEKHKLPRRQMLASTRLVMEWVAENYPGRTWHQQFRVGSDPEMVGVDLTDEGERRLARNLNRRVDVVIAPPPELVMIEATMWRPMEKVGQLEGYLLLLPATPEYRQWAGAPVVAILLTAQHDTVAEVLARERGIRYVWWEPPWMGEFLAIYPLRRHKNPHAGMTSNLARERLGET